MALDPREVRPRWEASEEDLVVERDGDGTVLVIVNRPATYNAFTPAMFDDLADICDEVASNPRDRVLVLTGAGDAFSSGADIGGRRARTADDQRPTPVRSAPADVDDATAHARAVEKARRISRPALALHRLGKPTIAAVNGLATGAGCSFALGCDLVLGTPSARFGLIFVQRALGLDLGATWLLPRAVGVQRARLMAFTGDWLEAPEAERLGVLLEVHPDHDALLGRALELAARLAALPPLALSTIKQGLDRAFELDFEEMVEHECRVQATCSLSADYREAIAAFREKRPPRFAEPGAPTRRPSPPPPGGG